MEQRVGVERGVALLGAQLLGPGQRGGGVGVGAGGAALLLLGGSGSGALLAGSALAGGAALARLFVALACVYI